MNKKVEKILNVLVIVFALIAISTNVFAAADLGITPGTLEGTRSGAADTVKGVGEQVVGILQTVGIILSVVVLIILGIKYMMGSAEEKAEYKKTFIPYIVGAALIFAASIFAQAIYTFFSNMTVS